MPPVSPNNLGTALPSDLSRLNVAQLKALCKERRVVGYSKLGKAALLQKLAELSSSSLPVSSAQSTLSQAQSNSLSSESVAAPRPLTKRTPALPSHEPVLATILGPHISQTGASSGTSASIATSQQRSHGLSGGQSESRYSPVPVANAPITKRVFTEMSRGQVQAGPLAKKPKVVQADSSASAVREAGNCSHIQRSSPLAGDQPVPVLPIFPSPGSVLLPKTAEPGSGRIQTISAPGNRFKPLTIMQSPSMIPEVVQVPLCLPGDESTKTKAHPAKLWYLDFPAPTEPPPLSSITLPPPLSQRKLVQRWAIALSYLSGKELFQCCLVSRLIRYAGKRSHPERLVYIRIHFNSLLIGLLQAFSVLFWATPVSCCAAVWHLCTYEELLALSPATRTRGVGAKVHGYELLPPVSLPGPQRPHFCPPLDKSR
jgi:hypothetical protein